MGYKEMDKVWLQSQAVKTDKLILLAIAKTYNPGKGSWPSQKHLAELCGISDRAVRSGLNRLLRMGELVWVRGNSYGKANLYLISFLEKNVQETSALEIQKLPLNMQETSGQNDKNFRPLDKQLNKLDKPIFMVFDSNPDSVFGKHIWGQRPGLSKLQVYEWLQAFERDKAFIIENAHTESLVKHVLAYIPGTDGEM
jgi:Helix-turn-helix domain